MGGVRGAQAPGHMTLLHARGALRKQTGRTLGPVSPGEGPAQGWGLWERGAPMGGGKGKAPVGGSGRREILGFLGGEGSVGGGEFLRVLGRGRDPLGGLWSKGILGGL